MCLGLPMQVEALDGLSGDTHAWCRAEIGGTQRRERVNVLWLGDVQPGEWIHVSLGQARERLTAERAAEIREALEEVAAALAAAAAGGRAA